MRIAILQGEARPLDILQNLETIRSSARAAQADGAELILTPELYVSGYAPRELADWLTPERVSNIPSQLADIAVETGVSIAASFPLHRQDGTYAIAAGLWDAAGVEVLRYEKVHLWGDAERLSFTGSSEAPAVASWNGRRVAFQICYDIEFPEPARLIAERGADLLLVPTAIDMHSAYVPEILVRARAAENGYVVAYADHASSAEGRVDSEVGFAGLSLVAGREGRVLASAGASATLLLADLPIPGITPQGSADYLRDRRPDVYSTWR